ncbi:MAG: rhomboid family intramembrane serine protease [Sedimentisphaerales bacterium]|nr:rhomboid family intramembrane serine protease [Sedimentisphaerales bacterium]
MGLYDRDYTQEDFKSQFRYSPQMNLPRITTVVKWLLLINIAVFIPSYISKPTGDFFYKWFSVWPETTQMSLQLWRVITYQFLHDRSGIGHIFFNMLVLFFFGPMLEGIWGGRKFLFFYLLCGAMGGLLYPMLALSGVLRSASLVGSSGSILGMLAAGAILFPHSIVLVMFVFPIHLWILAVILAAVSLMTLFAGVNQGGEVAHLAGMAAGAIYVLSDSWRERMKFKYSAGRWEKKISEQRNLHIELDRILDKVHKSGIHSLTLKEKRTLKKATKAEQMKNRL